MSAKVQSGFTGGGVSINNPRIGFQRIAGTLAASTSAAGFAAANARSYRTDTFWRPTSMPATWRIDAGSAVAVSYVGIAAHNLGTSAATVIVERSTDDTTWTEVDTLAPADNSALFFLFASASARYWRVRITGATEPTIGVIAIGPVLAMPQPSTYAPSTPVHLARDVSYAANITEGGQWAGRSIVRQAQRGDVQVEHLSETFVDQNLTPFLHHAETDPFFIAARPGGYAKDCAYAWTDSVLIPSRGVANASIAYSLDLQFTGFLA